MPQPTAPRFGFTSLLVASVLVLTATGFLGRIHWLLELTSHFRWQYAWLSGVLGIVALIRRRRGTAIAAVGGLAINLATLGWSPTPKSDGQRTVTRVISFNVLSANRQHDRTVEFIRSEQPDVVFLVEFNDRWQQALQPLRDDLPHYVEEPRDNNFGFALYSRHPLRDSSVVRLGEWRFPCLVATLDHGDRPLTLIGVHVPPPLGSQAAAERNREMAELAQLAAQSPHPVLLVGDLNATPWSFAFQDLLRDGSLRDSRRGFGLQASWRADVPWLLQIPIDHCLVSRAVKVRSRRLGPALGSDHLPVVIDVE